MRSARLACVLAGLSAIGACGPLAGCGHSGIVRSVVSSDDGRVLLYTSVNAGEGVYVADARGPVRIGGGGSAFLSRDGRYALMVDSRVNRPRWPGDRLVLYDVSARRRRAGRAVPANLYNPDSLRAADGWEPDLAEVRFLPDPAVVMGVRMANFREDPPRVLATRYVRWPAADGDKGAEALDGPAGTACSDIEIPTDSPESWVVVRQPDGHRNPFRTVWVAPDGTVVELLRSNQGFGAAAFNTIAFPFFFWSPGYYRMVGYLNEGRRADPAAAAGEESRLQELIARRKGQPTGRIVPVSE